MYRVGVLTLSDRGFRGEREDLSGKVIKEMVKGIQGQVVCYEVIPDDLNLIKEKLIQWSDEDKLNLILTTGGTGLSPRDVTPNATLEVIDYEVPGIGEAMRRESMKKTPKAILSRAVAGVRGQTLIINLPGSPKAVRECFGVIIEALPHGLDVLMGQVEDCAEK
ncbi:molybdenum cofactor biosynthesis protein [Anoxybacter fermentans]|uniref:Molybdenum cofactor biosynthesis protein B n=1 Tax=Anoxybacter fermentans TaxID=1323375 RepID=A0A3Q9HNF2_9FIRM|nr:molybdopterin adenylyltransferase [Anoxybacter fermentans]AZR72004.1 molybdenum cofactor biosynthesis protein [Anoxybacter fermentans]